MFLRSIDHDRKSNFYEISERPLSNPIVDDIALTIQQVHNDDVERISLTRIEVLNPLLYAEQLRSPWEQKWHWKTRSFDL